MRPLLPQKYHSYIYIFALILLVIGLPLSKFLLSLSQIILACNWLLEGNLKNKFGSFFKNKAALAASSILLLHFIGCLYSSDLNYAFKDIRIKTPLLVLPLILSTSRPLSVQLRHLVLKFLILSLLISSAISTLILTDVIHKHIADVRYVSIFISHVRLGLLISVAIFVCIYLLKHPAEKKLRWTLALLAIWFLCFLVLIESVTGLSALIIAGCVILMGPASGFKNSSLRYLFLLGFVVIVIITGLFAYHTYKRYSTVEYVDTAKLEAFTVKGNPYEHMGINKGPTESGHYVWLYYSEKELQEEWNKRSKYDFNWRNMRGDVIRFTLVRFLTSKGLRKDAEGLSKLSDAEIRAIERGVANVDYMSTITGRISEIVWEIVEYQRSGDANAHSISQRFEFWKAAVGIIKQHPVIGVGTGDIQDAFTDQYNVSNSRLSKEWRLRSHNQYLSITVAFGIIGLLWFLFSLIYPGIITGKFSELLYLSFFLIAAVSFLTEDTLETQVGVTFYAFLNSYFLFIMKKGESSEADLPVQHQDSLIKFGT